MVSFISQKLVGFSYHKNCHKKSGETEFCPAIPFVCTPKLPKRITAVLRGAPSGCLAFGNLLVGHGGCREAETQPPVPASQVRKPAAVIRNGGAEPWAALSCAALHKTKNDFLWKVLAKIKSRKPTRLCVIHEK